MGLFSKLRDAIFSKSKHAKQRGNTTPSSKPTPPSGGKPAVETNASPATPEPAAQRLTAGELRAQLDQMEKDHSEKLDWSNSIVDLMKLVGMDSSISERKELALDLGYSQADIDSKGSAEMNIWLHKTVMAKLSEDLDGNLDMK